MKALYIMKAGTTYPAMLERFSDFDIWIKSAITAEQQPFKTIDIEHKASFPPAPECAGLIITGSHDMITEKPEWSLLAQKQLALYLQEEIPVLGICYGHQLLAETAGGNVGYHAGGGESGSVPVRLLPAADRDPLFSYLPREFIANAMHLQTVQFLPDGAVCLAENDIEKTQAFRVGSCAWGVQFHPEFNAAITKAYIQEEARDLVFRGQNPQLLLRNVQDTPVAMSLLQAFADYCRKRSD